MIRVNRLSNMKSICGFSLFGTTLVLCLSYIHVIADSEKIFDCRNSIATPDPLIQVCPELDAYEFLPGPNVTYKPFMTYYIGKAVDAIYKRVEDNCAASVERMCNELPKIVLMSSAGGLEHCKRDLKEFVCEKAKDEKANVYCPYYEAIQTMIGKPEKWNANWKKDICLLFKENALVCFMVMRRLCERIGNMLVRNYCQNTLERSMCGGF